MRSYSAALGRLLLACSQDMISYFGMLKVLDITEEELLVKAKANPKIQPHVLAFVEAKDKAEYGVHPSLWHKQ
eukprot:SAG11_NODE_2408_length_3396_cov_2.260843_4_plen_73_part_00